MCKIKEEAGTKIDRLIASMDRLSSALEGKVAVTVSRGAGIAVEHRDRVEDGVDIHDVILTTITDGLKAGPLVGPADA